MTKVAKVVIHGNCTPAGIVALDFDENPNGAPVVWLHLLRESLPLDQRAVGQLIEGLRKMREEMGDANNV